MIDEDGFLPIKEFFTAIRSYGPSLIKGAKFVGNGVKYAYKYGKNAVGALKNAIGGIFKKGVGNASKYKDITTSGSRYINKSTNVTKTKFGQNLINNGWDKSLSKDGKTIIFQKMVRNTFLETLLNQLVHKLLIFMLKVANQ